MMRGKACHPPCHLLVFSNDRDSQEDRRPLQRRAPTVSVKAAPRGQRQGLARQPVAPGTVHEPRDAQGDLRGCGAGGGPACRRLWVLGRDAQRATIAPLSDATEASNCA